MRALQQPLLFLSCAHKSLLTLKLLMCVCGGGGAIFAIIMLLYKRTWLLNELIEDEEFISDGGNDR